MCRMTFIAPTADLFDALRKPPFFMETATQALTSNATASKLTPMSGDTRSAVNINETPQMTERVTEAVADTMPLSFGQRRLWLLEQLEPGSPLHHIAQVVRIRGPLDPLSLEWSLAAVIERHEALRSTFTRHGPDPVQAVSGHWTFRLARHALSEVRVEDQERALEQEIRKEATRPFDLSSDLLLRARLIRVNEGDHALVVVLHQIAADNASVTLLYQELSALYGAFSLGGITLRPDLPIDYGDYVSWQRTHLQGEKLKHLVTFWKARLADAPLLISLPSDRFRPPSRSYQGGVCTLLLPAEMLTKLHEFSCARRATLFMVLLAGFKTLLSRYTGQDDIVVGTPAVGRDRPDTVALIGHFTNTLVLRTKTGGNPTFSELLERVRETTVTAWEHQDLPFEKLVEELQPKRDLSYEPVCQVMFSLQEFQAESLKLPGLRTTIERLKTNAIRTDLNLHLVEEPAGLRVEAEYSLDLFDAGTVERLLGHFRTLLESITADPDRRICLLPLLTQKEHLCMLSWNANGVEYPKNKHIHEVFAEQVERTPDATAVVFNDRELSYASLNRLSEDVAERLRACGVGPETLVALCMERSLDMIVGLMGILKAGAAYVPLDPAFPADRLAFMLEDSEAQVIVTQRHLESLFQGKAFVICLDGVAGRNEPLEPGNVRRAHDAAVSAENLAYILYTSGSTGRPKVPLLRLPRRRDRRAHDAAASSENLAYILYTSGSTGRPKGVMISHRNVVNFFAGMDRAVGSEPGVWLAVTSISFDISVLELFWTLSRGFKVVILADQAGMRSLKNFSGSSWAPAEVTRSLDEQLVRHHVTHLQCTPSFARLLTRMPETLAALRPLRRMLVGGEGLPADLAEVLVGALDGELINMYGPTETTVWSTTHKVGVVRSGTVDIGRPIANTEIYILDRNRQLLPVGIPGELFIGGDGLARGYWRRTELTADRFVEHPFSPSCTGARLYRTGDLARYRADGVIEFLGRADHQVKIRGHRIELGEIEAVLAQHPGVQQSVVVVRTENAEDPRLAAYLVAAATGAPGLTVLKDFLREKLPSHMVPDFFVFLERLPLTPNGKIDRNALPVPARHVGVQATETPSLPGLEQAIFTIWKEILSVEHLGLDDNFFDVGGRSLHVVQVKSRLEESLGLELPIIKLFQYPTIRSLAEFIGSQSNEAESFRRKIQERSQRRQNARTPRRPTTEEANS